MGIGIVSKKVAAVIPVGDGKEVTMKDASSVAGVACEIHGRDVGILEFFALMGRPGGLDVCAECIRRVRGPGPVAP